MPSVIKICEKELNYRKQLESIGLINRERLPLPVSGKGKKGKKVKDDDGDFECETCRANLFVSLINNSQDDSVYCLPHALHLISYKKQILKHCTLMYTYDEVSTICYNQLISMSYIHYTQSINYLRIIIS